MQSLLSQRWLGAFSLLLCSSVYFPAAQGQVPATARPALSAPTESGYLGLIGDDRVTGGRGVQVLSVRGRGAAEAAGIRAGDLITAINRQQVNTVVQMAQQLAGVPAGAKIEIEFDRGGKRFAVPVTLGPRPAVDGAPEAPEPVAPPIGVAPPTGLAPPVATSSKPTLGVRVISPLDGARRGYAVYVRQGALIEHIEPNSPADRYGLSLGTVIVAIDGRRIDDGVDLAQAVAAIRPGEVTEVSYYRGEQLFRKQMRLTPVVAVAPPSGVPGEIVPKVTEFPLAGEGSTTRPRVPPPPPRPSNPMPVDPAPVTPAAPRQPLDPFLPPPAPIEPETPPPAPADPLLPPPVKAPVAPPVAAPVDPLITAKPPITPNPLPPSVLELDRKLTDPPKPAEAPAKPAELPAKPAELTRLKAELADTVSRITTLQREQQQLLQALEKLQKAIDDLEKNGER